MWLLAVAGWSACGSEHEVEGWTTLPGEDGRPGQAWPRACDHLKDSPIADPLTTVEGTRKLIVGRWFRCHEAKVSHGDEFTADGKAYVLDRGPDGQPQRRAGVEGTYEIGRRIDPEEGLFEKPMRFFDLKYPDGSVSSGVLFVLGPRPVVNFGHPSVPWPSR